MAYQINKTDGTILSTVADGQIDENSSDLTLIGRNYSGFGEILNENFVKLLEHFSSSASPRNPVRGQIWFDAGESKLKVYNGVRFVPVSSATISNSQPTNLGIGDLWYNDVAKQLFFFDGTSPVLLAPAYSEGQSLSGLKVESVLDTLNQTRVITLLYNNGVLLGIFAKDQFDLKNAISGFSGRIEPGFNAGSLSGIKFKVTVTNSEKLGGQDALTYVRRDTSNTIDGQLRLTSDLGLVIGSGGQGNFVINDGNLLIANAATEKNIRLSVRRGIDQEDGLIISPSNRTVSIYPGFSDSEVEIGGSLTISGDLTVNGTTTTVNTSNLTIEDKNIELALQTGITPTDVNADGGGIILRGSSNHVLLWSNTGSPATPELPALYSQAWNSSEHINLATNKYYAIDGIPLLIQTSTTPGLQTFKLTDRVTAIDGVTNFGKQNVLNVGPGLVGDPPYIRIQDNRISTLSGVGVPLNLDLELYPLGDIVLPGSAKITNLSDPVSTQDASTKGYVDNKVESRNIVLSIDISDGKSNSYIVNNILNNIAPPAEYRSGTQARILCTILSNSSTTFDMNAITTLSTNVFVTPTPGTASAVTNIAFSPPSIPGQGITAIRIVKIFQVILGAWSFISDTPLPA